MTSTTVTQFELLESSGINKNGQHKKYRSTYSYGEHKIRINVDLDTSYPRMQSSCKAEVWYAPELRWHVVATLQNAEWTEETYAIPHGREFEDESIMDCELALQSQIVTVLG